MRISLTYEQISRLESDDYSPRPIKHWTLEDLSKGRGMPQGLIKKCVKNANIRRQQHMDSRGWTKNKHMRSEVRLPTWLYLQPEFQNRYFPEQADEHEKAKALEKLKKDFPIFVTH